MCRILGITNYNYCQHQALVERFCQLVSSGMVIPGDPPGHEDGWGIAFYQDDSLVVHKSGTSLHKETDKVFGILSAAKHSPVMILHLRKSAWDDSANLRHAHPFHYNNTAFFHNGVVYDYQELIPGINIPAYKTDALDTEVFFYHFMSLKAQDLGEAFLQTVSEIKQKHRYSALNCVFSDGKTLFAYRDYTKEPDYYSLYKAREGKSWIISSEPLGGNIQWHLMEREEFLAIEL